MNLQALRHTKPAITAPTDFNAFWRSALQSLDDISCDVNFLDRTETRDDFTLDWLTFQSADNTTITGYRILHPDHANVPTVLYTHGYNAHCEPIWDWAKKGFNVFGYDTRGFGQSIHDVQTTNSFGYIIEGYESPTQSILRGAVLDAAQASRMVANNIGPTAQPFVHYGYSFGGAMALMAESLACRASHLVIGVPTFGWHEARLKLVKQGSGREVLDFLAAQPEQKSQLMNTLNYFDSVHFASRAKTPTMIGIGLEDAVVPAETVFAIANNLANKTHLLEYPVSHSDDPREVEWQHFEDTWMQWVKQLT